MPTASPLVLIVDDNLDAANSLAALLQLSGYVTHLAHDGLAALEIAEIVRPGVIILDIGMPKMNGHEAARRIRQQPWGKDTLLVAVSGWGQPEDRRRSREAGFHTHLTKPVDADQVATAFAAGEGGSDRAREFTVPSLARVEWEHIQRVMTECQGNVSQAARVLGLHRRSLQRKLAKYPVSR